MKSTEIKHIKSLKISAEGDETTPQTASPASLITNHFDLISVICVQKLLLRF